MAPHPPLEKLALLVTSDRYCEAVKGVLAQARKQGIELTCFLTGRGVRALRDPVLLETARSDSEHVCVCELSWEREQMGEHLEDVTYGSQFQNSQFIAWADKVLVM